MSLTKFEAEYASLAKEFKPGYPPLDNVKARIEETRRRLTGEIDKEVKSIEAGFAAASNKETELRATMEEQKKATLNLKDSAVQYAILAREVDTNKQLYDGVLSALERDRRRRGGAHLQYLRHGKSPAAGLALLSG